MAATLLFPPFQTFLNPDTGLPLAGGLIYTYEAGLSDLLTVYKNSDRDVEWTNPIELDASGMIPSPGTVFPPDGSIKVVVKDADDVTLRTYDNIGTAEPTNP